VTKKRTPSDASLRDRKESAWPADKVERRALASLIPYARNARTHTPEQVSRIAASIREFGWTMPVLVDSEGTILAGHARVLAAQQLALDEVPCIVATSWTEAQRRAYVIADNKLALDAGWDEEMLAAEFAELRGLGFDLALTGFDPGELQSFEPKLDVVDDEAPPPPVHPVSRLGDIWLLDGHRVCCGDSTDAAQVATLMKGEVASLLATDPPYLVDYDGSNHPADHHKKAGRKASAGKELGNKHWDEYVDPEASVAFFATFLEVALSHCIERVPVYQWHATRRQSLVEQAWHANGLLVHQTLVWVKSRGVLTRSHFLWQHEPCFYGWREGKMPEKGRRPEPSLTTVWQIDQVGQQDGIHPTQKPLRIFEIPINAHTRPWEVVLEPFSGSGSQLVAAHALGRRCFAMELSPAFTDVAVRRLLRVDAGVRVTLEETGESFDEVAARREVPVS
jgi:DNA modification methylase